jgi:hypothetical protein
MALIWGIPYLFIKIAVGELTPATLVFARSLIGASLLSPLAVAQGDLAKRDRVSLEDEGGRLLTFEAAEIYRPAFARPQHECAAHVKPARPPFAQSSAASRQAQVGCRSVPLSS